MGTAQLNQALALRLAAEFQGFARDLHDESLEFLISELTGGVEPLMSVLRLNFTANRKLDRGNAQPASLGNDFGRFGFKIWPALKLTNPKAPAWQNSLEQLNNARNAIIHANDGELQQLPLNDSPMRLRPVKRWRTHLCGLAEGMDTVLATSLAALCHGKAPW